MVANLGQPIEATLNYQPGGNPLLGLAGGIGGLAQQYGQDYNAYLAANQTNYNNITKGYGTVMQNVANSLGQGGTPWGVAQGAADDINSAARNAAGGSISRSISSGTGKSTAAASLQRGVLSTQSRQLRDLGLNLADRYAGYQSQIGQNELGFMNSVQAPPPNAAAYGMLAQQYGQTQQQAANMAMQQQALDAQKRASNQAAARGMSGGGGVSIPQAPRGGTYGSGSSGFPSGGGVSPTAGGNPYAFLNSGNQSSQFNNVPVVSGSAGSYGGSGIDQWPGSSFWPTPADATGATQGGIDFYPLGGASMLNQQPAGGGEPAGGFGDMSGHFGFSGMDPWGG